MIIEMSGTSPLSVILSSESSASEQCRAFDALSDEDLTRHWDELSVVEDLAKDGVPNENMEAMIRCVGRIPSNLAPRIGEPETVRW